MTRPPVRPDDVFKRFAYDQFARIGKAVCAPQRLVLLNILAQGPHTVEELAGQAGLTLANASRHLQVLKAARLVESERRGTFVTYRLTGDDVRRFFHAMKDLAFAHSAELREALDEVARSETRTQAVGRDELLARLSSGDHVVIDVRPESEYRTGHLPGAVSVPLDQLRERLATLPKDRRIVAYCRGRYCLLADRAVEALRAEGYLATRTDVEVVGWELANLPVERDPR